MEATVFKGRRVDRRHAAFPAVRPVVPHPEELAVRLEGRPGPGSSPASTSATILNFSVSDHRHLPGLSTASRRAASRPRSSSSRSRAPASGMEAYRFVLPVIPTKGSMTKMLGSLFITRTKYPFRSTIGRIPTIPWRYSDTFCRQSSGAFSFCPRPGVPRCPSTRPGEATGPACRWPRRSPGTAARRTPLPSLLRPFSPRVRRRTPPRSLPARISAARPVKAPAGIRQGPPARRAGTSGEAVTPVPDSSGLAPDAQDEEKDRSRRNDGKPDARSPVSRLDLPEVRAGPRRGHGPVQARHLDSNPPAALQRPKKTGAARGPHPSQGVDRIEDRSMEP